MARKRKPLNDPHHTATHEAGHAERVAAALLAEQDLSGERIDELAGRSVADVPDRRPAYLPRNWA
jgi:hypothetical protein